MRSSNSPYLAATIVLLAGIIGWLIMRDTLESTLTRKKSDTRKTQITQVHTSAPPSSSLGKRSQISPQNTLEDVISVKNERLVRFSSEEAYRNALRRLKGAGLTNLGQLDSLRVLRLRYRDLADLEAFLGDDAEVFRNFYSRIPDFIDPKAQPDAVPFGSSMLEFLGITEDNSAWGSGTTLAIVDSGVSPHITLPNVKEQINFVELGDGATQNGHGTAVASLAAGQHSRLRGVAPGADIQPYRVANEHGVSNDFQIMQAFVDASERGIPIIAIALGGYGHNQLMQDLVNQFADQGGPIIIASSGNEGASSLAFPAGYDNVYSVGAIDANGIAMTFSNQGETLDFMAPGNGVEAAWPGERIIGFTGTSAGPGIIAGIVAAIQSESPVPVTYDQAIEAVVQTLNDGGQAGPDPVYGNGIVAPGRTLRRNEPNIQDLAVASNYFNEETGLLETNIQNQGTANSPAAEVNLNAGTFTTKNQIGSLQPGEVTTVYTPSIGGLLQSDGEATVLSSVKPRQSSNDDINRNNNQRRDILRTEENAAAQAN